MSQSVESGPAVHYSAALTSIDASQYEAQLATKVAWLETLFQDLEHPPFAIHRSEPEHFRMRTEFDVWHSGDSLEFQMFEKDPKTGERRPVRVDQFPVASKLCNSLMTALLRELPLCQELRSKLFQVNLHTTLSGQAMVTLLYHRKLGDAWQEAAQKLRVCLGDLASPIHIIGRSRGQKICLDADEVEETLTVEGQTLRYVQVEANFSQPNAGISVQMLAWARRAAQGSGARDLLELYCGNGNFTAALAPRFRRVVATEVSKRSVAAARRNCAQNGVNNVFLARMRSEEFTEAWRMGGKKERLKGLDLVECDFQTLLVDPPRAGLDPDTLQLLHEFDNVIYISCNPETLHANLVAVKDTFDIVEYAVFDQFPWTPHIESGVYLQRKAGAPRPPKSSSIPDVAPENTAAPQGVKRKAEGVEAAS
ncbi:TMU1 [Auxenochlorella protothecoides x Auxenochlorella symbiontica]